MTGRVWKALLAAASIRFWAMVGAAMMLTAFAAWLVWIVAWHWPPPVETGRRLDILGKALWIVLGGIVLVVIALTGKRVEASGLWGRLDVRGGDDPASPP
ncbi:MAG TPA: hypothetical protein VGC16_03105 [Rhizomicrobium sp.]